MYITEILPDRYCYIYLPVYIVTRLMNFCWIFNAINRYSMRRCFTDFSVNVFMSVQFMPLDMITRLLFSAFSVVGDKPPNAMSLLKLGVALTERNTTGPPSRATPGELRCICASVECYRRRQMTESKTRWRASNNEVDMAWCTTF